MHNSVPSDVRSRNEDHHAHERYQGPRPSLPVLQTRMSSIAYPDLTATNPPMDGYTYSSSTMPRQDSLVGAYTSACSVALPPTPAYYEPQSGYSYSPMYPPAPQYYTRPPSMSTESSSSFNMGRLHTSLPAHAAHDRRLPAPYVSQYAEPPYVQPEPHGSRPLGSFSCPRFSTSGVQAREPPPWSSETIFSRPGSMSAYPSTSGLLNTAYQPYCTASEAPMMGYQFQPATTNASYGSSPDLSPTAPHASRGSYDSSSNSSDEIGTHMQYSSGPRYYPAATSQSDFNAMVSASQPMSPAQRHAYNMPSLYSYGTTSSHDQDNRADQLGNILPCSTSGAYSPPARHGSVMSNEDSPYQNPLQHPRPISQHTSSAESLCRQSPFEQQTPRSSTASRMSISNFSGSYQ